MLAIGLPGIAYLALQSPGIQNRLVNPLKQMLSESFGTTISFESLRFAFFNRLVIEDFYIEDEYGDTLLFTEKLTGNLKRFSSAERLLDLAKITLDDCLIRFATDSSNRLNLSLITDQLRRKDTTRAKMVINIAAIDLNNGCFVFDAYRKKEREGINFTDTRMEKIFLQISDLDKQRSDTLTFHIDRLEFIEKSGFKLNSLTATLRLNKSFISLSDLDLETPGSTIKSPRSSLYFSSFRDLGDFVNKVDMDLLLDPSEISSSDLAYFTGVFRDINENILFTGNIYGGMDDLKGKEVHFLYGEKTGLIGNFNFIGLPDIRETYIYLDINNFTISLDDIDDLTLPGKKNGLRIPENLKQLGEINFKGNFTGFIDDFVTYGFFSTQLGRVSSDLSIKPDSASRVMFRGKIETSDLQIGKLADLESALGKVSMNIELSGYSHAWKTFSGSLGGMIGKLDLNGYTYRNIELNGQFDENAYEGSIFIDDPNIRMNFLGLVDLTQKLPEFDFTANIFHANLYNLNLIRRDSTLTMNMLLTANFRGGNLDNMEGTMKMLNASFFRGSEELNLYDFTLTAVNTDERDQLLLRTDYLDADLNGKYEFKFLGDAFRHVVYNYLPAFRDTTFLPEKIAANDFSYSFRFKNASPLLDFFLPGTYLSLDASIEGVFRPIEEDFTFRFEGREAGYRNYCIRDFSFMTLQSDTVFSLLAQSQRVNLNQEIGLQDFRLTTRAVKDSIYFRAVWDDRAYQVSRGNINSSVVFRQGAEAGKPQAYFNIYPSEIVVRDSIWFIQPGTIRVDTSSVAIDRIVVGNRNQLLTVTGALSHNPKDTLYFSFEQLSVDGFNQFIKADRMKFEGRLNGVASLTGIYSQPVFVSNLWLDDLKFNGERLGHTRISSQWNDQDRSFLVRTSSDIGGENILNVNGYFYTREKELDFRLNANKLSLGILSGFLDKIFPDMGGQMSGDLVLTGTSAKPVLNGRMDLQQARFTLNYLNSHYNFSHSIEIRDNSFYLNKLRLYDMNGNLATVNGSILNNYFREFEVDLSVNAERFNFLNTTEGDNSVFYGIAYGTGIIRITGVPRDMKIIVSAKTERNTRIFIPISPEEEIADYQFIRFINTPGETREEIKQEEYQVNLAGLQLDFDLEITPDAEAQIIFDSKMGDVLRGKGSGNLKMEINTLGRFVMMGEYEIQEGNYMFTLQNIQVRKFDVEQGGKIIWTGDPLDATIDMKAAYKTRVSLYDLAMDQNYNRRMQVNCNILLKGRLMNPEIVFDIELPTADEETRNYLSNFINTQQKLMNQFLSLLVLDSFVPDQNLLSQSASGSNGFSPIGVANVGATTSKILSNQLGNWISEIDEDFDIGFNYIPGDEMTTNQLEVALSTQLLNDRVTINGYVDVGGNVAQTQASRVQGEFDMDIKLNQSGKFRLKAFNRANDKLIYELAPYTQGIGLFYREEFDRFSELLRQYWNKMFSPAIKEEED